MNHLSHKQMQQIQHLFPSFAHLPAESWDVANILSINPATSHSIREGHILQHAMFIVSGQIRVFKLSQAGREITLYRVHGGQCCVLMMASILGETEYEASVAIEADTEVLLLPVSVFRDWMNTIKPIRQYIYKQFIDRMTNVTKLLENVAFQPLPYRIAKYLLSESVKVDCLQLTHERIAIEIGTSREVITRILKNFVGQGAIALSRGKITILDRGILKAIVEQHL
jgi:CRP/FNR family transcriptional regulator